MAAPAGVNGGLHFEPVTPGGGHATPAEAEAEAAEAEAGSAVAEAGSTVAEAAEHAGRSVAELAEAAPAEGDAAAPAGAGTAEARTVVDDQAGPEPGAAAGERRDLSPLAIIGIAVGIMALVGVAVGVLAVITHGFRPKVVVTYRPAAVFKLRPGDCLNSGPNGLTVTRLSCATPHDAEVFATFPLPGASWPGAAVVRQDAGSGCASRLGGYLNPQLASAGLAQEFVYPDRTAWQAGVRTVVCEVSSPSGQLTGSVRNPGG